MQNNEKYAKIALVSAIVLTAGVLSFIYINKIKSVAKQVFGGYEWFEEGLSWYRNASLKAGVEDLHPQFRDDMKEFFSWIEKNTDWTPVWSSGRRTFEYQARLKKKDSRNAAAGHSNHNYGFAVDINLRNSKTGEELKKASSKARWLATGIPQKAKAMGMKWGGDFKGYHDPIHFAKVGVPTTSQLFAIYNKGQVDLNGYVLV